MSRCFTLVYYWWFRKTQVIPELGVFYKNMGVTWRVVWLWRISGILLGGCL